MTEFVWTGLRSLTFAAALSLAIAVPVQAQQDAGPATAASEVQQMYDSALQSIAEGRKNDASAVVSRSVFRLDLTHAFYCVVRIYCINSLTEDSKTGIRCT